MATHMAPQSILSLPVQQVAISQQLGAFVKTYQATLKQTIGATITFMVATLFFCGGGLLPPDLTIATRVVLVTFGLLSLALVISMLSSIMQTANQQIHLFQQGMVIEKGEQVQALPWHQATEVWQSITRNYRNGSYVGTTYTYTLLRADGYKIKLGNLTKDIAELGPAIAQGITRAMVPRALHAIRTGQTLTFATFSINQQGISHKHESLLWSQVQSIDVNQGRMTIKKIGTSRPLGTAMVAKIPNFLVFTVVAEELLRQARGGR